MKKFLIDISHHQGIIDWHTVANENNPKIDGVFIKCTQGTTFLDSQVKFNALEAKRAGIDISYYHFATLNSTNIEQDAKAEADFFVSQLKKLPPNDMPLVLDIEENKANLPTHHVLDWIHYFFDQLEIHGYNDYILYSYTPFLNANLPSNHGLGTVPLWIAAYVNKPQPKLPIGWDKYWLWQYSAKGKIKGIKTDVDLNKSPE